ncbi:MAG TPA: ferrichrome ABC transporter permease [Lachnoclostridium sp.]|jgi:iron complex transport system permease protein|uniref:FecCD family ABC transporter permease n=1 Tax=Lacrimispora sp. TaxID=2719234 RepID=UPI000EEA219D|nr:iron ABC transporter permease [Lacrimispora sp.]HCD45866.1 ferrichrome ABC transporter permease [Lachnoclostridium sp.]
MMINKYIPNKSGSNRRSIPLRPLITSGMILLILLLCFSITQGTANISMDTVVDAFTHFDSRNPQHLMIIDLRLPRVLISGLIGAALAVAGAIMQGTTRNPMADSGLMGINAGAGFAIALCFAFMPGISYGMMIVFAFLGAALGALLINGIAASHKGGRSPMGLVLSGAAVSTLLTALSQGIALSFHVGRDVLFWTVGGVASVTWQQFYILAPVVSAALAGAFLLSPYVSILNMGEDVATGLGLNTTLIHCLCTLAVLALAGISVSVVGSVSFVGLIIPHGARFLVGVDYKKIIPSAAVLGALLLVLADLGARTVNPPFEVPLGVITSLIGVPFFLYLSHKKGGLSE